MSDQPKPTGEWTVERLEALLPSVNKATRKLLADAINAALDAAKEEAYDKGIKEFANEGWLKAHDAKVIAAAQQPLVDALHRLAMRVLQSDFYPQAKQETDDALLLAKVKEGK